MELHAITDGVFYLDGAANLGVISDGHGTAVLVDAGLDDSIARRAHRLLTAAGLTIGAIVITHAHADHCGGAGFLVKKSGASVYAAAAEKGVLETPALEPLYLFGGAYPPAPLRSKFFLAPGVAVDKTVAPGPVNIAGVDLEIVPLPGHTVGQIGVAAQGVLFCADAVLSAAVLAKHGLPLNAHIAAALASYDVLTARQDAFFLPAHGELVTDIRDVVAVNRRRVAEVLDAVLVACRGGATTVDILKRLGRGLGLPLGNMGQYYLTRLSVMAYVSHLVDSGQLTAVYQDGQETFITA